MVSEGKMRMMKMTGKGREKGRDGIGGRGGGGIRGKKMMTMMKFDDVENTTNNQESIKIALLSYVSLIKFEFW